MISLPNNGVGELSIMRKERKEERACKPSLVWPAVDIASQRIDKDEFYWREQEEWTKLPPSTSTKSDRNTPDTRTVTLGSCVVLTGAGCCG